MQVVVANALAAAIPWLPLFRRARGAVTHLIELAADDRAARQAGATSVHRALLVVGARGGQDLPPSALGAAASAIDVRLSELARGAQPRSSTMLAGERACVLAVGTLCPALTGGIGIVLLSLISCV